MKKIKLFIGLFVFCLILFPGIKAKAATEVSDEAGLRSAVEQGGDIILQSDISLTEPLVINKDVSISCLYGCSIYNNADEELIIVNGGNVEISGVYLSAGKYDDYGYLQEGGTALTVNGGSVKCGVLQEFGQCEIDSGDTAVIVNNGATVSLNFPMVYSYQENGIEVNDGTVVNIEGGVYNFSSNIFGSKNAIYLNGGTVNLSSLIEFSTSDTGYTIYMNKGVNTATNGNALVFKDNFVFSYQENRTFSFNMYVNPDINELKVADEKDFLVLKDNKLNVGYCSACVILPRSSSQSEEDREAVCKNLGGSYNGTIDSNELKSCTAVYINGEKTVIDEESCRTEEPAQVVTVPSTFLSNMYYVVIGVVLVIIAAFIIYMIVSKKEAKK